MTATLISLVFLLGVADAATPQATASTNLVAALEDGDPDIRALAASLLAEEEPGAEIEALEALRARLSDRDESWRVRVAAAEALAEQGPGLGSVTQDLVDVVLDGSEDWRVRAAAFAVARHRGGGSLLARALADSAELRISNGHSSVSLQQPLADGGILEALTDPDARMRALAREALDGGLEIARVVAEPLPGRSPCLSEVLNRMLSQASTATGTLALY